MGKITLRDLIYGEGYAQGIRGGRKLKAVVPGGSSTPVLTASEIDVAMDFDGVAKAGSMLGSAGIIVMDDSTCMVWMAKNLIYFYKHESCGKCSPCREGTGWMLRLLERIEAGVAKDSDLDLLWKVTDSISGKTVCPFGDAAIAPPQSTLNEVPGGVRVPRAREALLEDGGPHVRGGPREERGDGMSPSPAVQELILAVAKIAVVVGALLGLFAVMTWIERRALAFMQFRLGPNRTGPFGILQPIADGIKLFFKEESMPAAANKWAFLAAPVLAVSTALLAVAVLPYGPPFTLPSWGLLPEWLRGRAMQVQIASIDVGLLFIFAITALGVYGIVLAGWAANNKYSLLGGLRSSAQMFSYELALGLSWVGVIMLAGSFQITDIVNSQARFGGWFLGWNAFVQLPAFLVYFLAATAEVARIPFDLPEGEAELVAGFHTEYSSMRFALIQMAEYINMITVAVLGTNLFLGGWHAGIPGLPSEGLPGFVWWGAKVAVLLFVFIWLRGTLPRVRYDQLMHFGWKVLVPVAAVWILVTAAGVALFPGLLQVASR